MDFEEVMQALEDANYSFMNIWYMGAGTAPDESRPVSDWLKDVDIYDSSSNSETFGLMWDSNSSSFVIVCAGDMLEDWFTVIPCYPQDSYGAISVDDCKKIVEYLNNTIPQAEAFTNAVRPFL